jgi:hypothetical protein
MKRRRVAQNTTDAAQAMAMAGEAVSRLASGGNVGSSIQTLVVVAAGTQADVAPAVPLTAKTSGRFLVLAQTSGTAGVGGTDMLGNIYATIGGGPRNPVALVEMAGIAATAPLAAATKTGCTMIALVTGVPIGTVVNVEMSAQATGGSYTAAPLEGQLIVIEL